MTTSDTTGTLAMPPDSGDRPTDDRLRAAHPTLSGMAAVDELCSVLARILMRINAEQQHDADDVEEGGEA